LRDVFAANRAAGRIAGDQIGVAVSGGLASLTNAGSITATGIAGVGVQLGSGKVTNQVGGVISGGKDGVDIAAATTLANAGATSTSMARCGCAVPTSTAAIWKR